MRRPHRSAAAACGSDVAPASRRQPEDVALASRRQPDIWCVVAVIAAALALHGPAIVRGRVLLPADVVLLMRPWGQIAVQRFPELRYAQNQLLGPIFEYYPWRHYSRSRIRAGELPLWNPYEMGGNVLLANSQSAVLYPPNALLYVLPLWVGINLVTLFHTTTTGLLMLGLLRCMGLRPGAAVAGAFTWMLCGCLIVWTEFQTPTAALCWLPGALWAAEVFVRRWASYKADGAPKHRRGAIGALVLMAVALALALVAGHPQFAFYVVLAVAITMALRTPRAALWALPTTLVLAGSIGAATLIPVAEAARINHRGRDAGFAKSVKLRIPPSHLTSVLLPNVRGNPRHYVTIEDGEAIRGHGYVGAYDFTELCCYVGIPALILAGLGLLWRGRDRGATSLWVVGLVGLALALGTPVGALLYYAVPGYSQFYAPARALCLVQFALAALAAFGLDAALDRRRTALGGGTARSAAIVCAVVGAAAALAWPLSAVGIPVLLAPDWLTYEAHGLRNAVLFSAATATALWLMLRPSVASSNRPALWGVERLRGIGAVALPALCALDLLIWGGAYNPALDPKVLAVVPSETSVPDPQPWARAVSFEAPEIGMKSLIVPNYNAVLRYREAQGADSVHSRRYHEAMQAVAETLSPRRPAFPDHNTIRLPLGHHPLLDVLDVTHATTHRPYGPPGPRYVRATDGWLWVWRNPDALGPARLVRRTETASGPRDAVEKMGRAGHDPRSTAIVERPVHRLPQMPAGQARAVPEEEVRLLSWEAHRVQYAATATELALLVTSEVAHPGWTATIRRAEEGRAARRETPIVIADAVVRAVVVPAGRSVVTFRYEPAGFRLGLFVSLVASLVLSACGSAALFGMGRPAVRP